MAEGHTVVAGPSRHAQIIDGSDKGNDSRQHALRTRPQPTRIPQLDCRDDDIWGRKIILSLDGGGMRGYASLLILKNIMAKVTAVEQELNEKSGDAECHGSAAYPWCNDKNGREGNDVDQAKGFRPHHYMDYFVGTSTGGLSSIMLGRLQMTEREAMDEYNKVGSEVFCKPRLGTANGLLGPRYSSGKLEQTLQRATDKDIFHNPEWYEKVPKKRSRARDRTRHLADKVQLRSENQDSARTVVVAAGGADPTGGRRETYLFRSYDHPHPSHIRGAGIDPSDHLNPGPACDLPLWIVGRATSAAPTYFTKLKIGENEFKDGAVDGQNNPVILAYNEVRQMHPSYEPRLVISIGTGEKHEKTPRNRWYRKLNKYLHDNFLEGENFRKKVLDTQPNHSRFRGMVQQVNRSRTSKREKITYVRFNVSKEYKITASRLDDWRGKDGRETISVLRDAVDKYCELPEVARNIKLVAKKLVKYRRKRAQTEEWERFALRLKYECRGPPDSVAAETDLDTTSSSSDEDNVVENEAPSRNEAAAEAQSCQRILFMSRAELREHGERVHGLIRQVECFDEGGKRVGQWTCFRRQCAEKPTVFEARDQMEKHLKTEHNILKPRFVSHTQFEHWLNESRRSEKDVLQKKLTIKVPAMNGG